MKKVKMKVLKSYSAIITGILAMLGFASSCDSKAEYGTPSADFIVNGKVTSEETDLAVKNIRVIMEKDTVYSDNDGNYQVEAKGRFPQDQDFLVQFQDYDKELNGEFQDLDTTIEFKDPKFTDGDGDWYKGKTTKEFNLKLIPKK